MSYCCNLLGFIFCMGNSCVEMENAKYRSHLSFRIGRCRFVDLLALVLVLVLCVCTAMCVLSPHFLSLLAIVGSFGAVTLV